MYDRLVSEFGAAAVFKDVDTLPIGEDFGAYINRSLEQCRVVLVLIGPDWRDENQGQSRLDSPDDWVRIEIETALRLPGIQVVPVLMNSAQMPRADQLPATLRQLRAFNAATVRRDPDFHRDMDKLIKALREGALTGTVVVEEAPTTPASKEWAKLRDSIDIEELRIFAEQFPNTSEGLESRRRIRFLEGERELFDEVNWNDASDIQGFIAYHPEHHLLQEARDRLLALQRAQEAAAIRVQQQRAANAARAERIKADIEDMKKQQAAANERLKERPEFKNMAKRAEGISAASSGLSNVQDGIRFAGCWLLGGLGVAAWFWIALPMLEGWHLLLKIAIGVIYVIAIATIVGVFNDWAEDNLVSSGWEEKQMNQLENEAMRMSVFKEMETTNASFEQKISALNAELDRLRQTDGIHY